MLRIKELIAKLKADHPTIQFVPGDDYLWSSDKRVLSFPSERQEPLYLLHELAHALLNHTHFRLDIELLGHEREAWDFVRDSLAPRYNIIFDTTLAEAALETYREWLYARSICPRCGQTGLQTKTSIYTCINCRCSWRPNDARRCALRRYAAN